MQKKPKVYPETGRRVFVGVSGGVDSSVSLALLQKQGYDVTGVFLKVWHPDFLLCDWKEERRSAMRVCATLGVPFLTINCEDEYKKDVADYMIREYKAGRVPNPDVFCNKYIKFGVFLKKAKELGADFIATGHYSRVEEGKLFSNGLAGLPRGPEKKTFLLLESVDKDKDQSYFLYTLTQDQLSQAFFPVGGMNKLEVRRLAKKFDLPTAEKKDSQGLCFIGKINLKDFLSHYIKTEEGNVLNTNGEVIGEHPGVIFFAIGQRHGFDITKKSAEDPRFFVISKDMVKNTITVADKENNNDQVYSVKEIVVPEMHFISGKKIENNFEAEVKIRYRQEKQNCIISKKTDGYHIEFKERQNGISIGQSAVLYEGEVCLGGGIIEKIN